MTRPRSVAYRALTVHEPASAAPRPPARSAAAGFVQSLRRARSTTTSRGLGEASALEADAQTRGLPEPDAFAPEPVFRSDDGGAEQDSDHEQDATPYDDVPEWTTGLAPTSESLDALLADVCRERPPARPRLPAAIESIAQTIAGFCNEQAVNHSEGWNVRIALRPDVFPDTTLELGIAAYWLQLRFLVGSAPSRELLMQHSDALSERLADSLARRREIAITID